MHCDPLKFDAYERNLGVNLKALQSRLERGDWVDDTRFIGGYAYVPKSITEPDSWKSGSMHFSISDVTDDWSHRYQESSRERARADFRLVIRASIEYQIVSALWIIKAGEGYDAKLDPKCTYGNRLRRAGSSKHSAGVVNEECAGLFVPYFGAYSAWRKRGLQAMRTALVRDLPIISVTMDIRRFYHNVSPTFLLAPEFMEVCGVHLSEDQRLFTQDFIESIQNWYRRTPDAKVRPEGGLPVGLSASKIISNLVLVEFDRLIQKKLKPIYYGRYVDDLFLVCSRDAGISSGRDFLKWIAELSPKSLKVISGDRSPPTLLFAPPYAEDSLIEFSGDKQKIFVLSGRQGLDLIDQIEDQIKQKSSEHRLLPDLPEDDSEMISKALLATPDATLEADALRKADVVSVRRLGFALLLRDIEAHARDLKPRAWLSQRSAFYGLVLRHVLTPRGFFNYHAYLDRVFGLMVACGDHEFASQFLDAFERVATLIKSTSTAGTDQAKAFRSCLKFYGEGFYRTAIQSSTVGGFKFSPEFLGVLRKIKRTYDVRGVPQAKNTVKDLSERVLRCDFGRRSYKDFWFEDNRDSGRQPPVSKDKNVLRALRLAGITRFRKRVTSGLKRPYWPAIAFPTRPLSVAEIIFSAPALLESPVQLEDAIFSLRGARIRIDRAPRMSRNELRPHVNSLSIPYRSKPTYKVALTSFLSSDEQWNRALLKSPDLGVRRYKRIHRLINDILRCDEPVDYIVFPEASLPRRWAIPVSIKLAKLGISVLCGLENWKRTGAVRNDALISLASRWPGYGSHVLYAQPKMIPAHHEAEAVENAGRVFYKPPCIEECRPIFRHGSHFFSVLLCSDLTNIDNRRHAQGFVDSVFALEWNPDTTSFSALVESAALDVHAYVVQVNNRRYGDSRVRAPFRRDFERDVVRVKGGDEDYFVVASLNVAALRSFHRAATISKDDLYKPLPIGFEMSIDRELEV
ncbi:Reverse transcriptase (RNA-dependent DNA polymerase) [Luteibacter sp. UNC138MFCol5.1]|nr:Reverse transcriptase (RNA-dependent DNA polymerase) [Luteibacter sp. UNC138MFCol5.1]